jgi:hypothetical protein
VLDREDGCAPKALHTFGPSPPEIRRRTGVSGVRKGFLGGLLGSLRSKSNKAPGVIPRLFTGFMSDIGQNLSSLRICYDSPDWIHGIWVGIDTSGSLGTLDPRSGHLKKA